ncbi:hypothetical protein Ddye_003995 [Dipteronia dyeriana]|uniref:Uncharacterized protein n=1 Tax=Dipteronia dyeriana TaxID=168575 RepID=A0AAD9XTW9_9ROSI|nr:hypothetical protein Ddye_003995 [Dipteronia dyeriana]
MSTANATTTSIWSKKEKYEKELRDSRARELMLTEKAAILEKKSIEERKSTDSQDNLAEDTLAKFVVPERRGQVRALAFGVTPSQVNVHIQ